MISTLAVANYRSLRNVIAPLDALNLVSGENGSGKSSLYRALRLLADTAQGSSARSTMRFPTRFCKSSTAAADARSG